jgi:iron complex outermembrane receptor protein
MITDTWLGQSIKHVLLLGVAVAGLPHHAYAQTTGTAAKDPASATSLGEIVVTAQKREQVAQDVPIALYAIRGATLESEGITSIQDLGSTLAGVNVTSANPGEMNLIIRGMADLSGSLQASPVNGYYLDETPVAFVPGYMPDLGLWDVDRIEVLRGPQGTLFGEGSEGGTLRVITKKPDSTKFFGRYDISATQTSGGGNGYSALGTINIPLQTNVAAISLAANYRDLPGWIDIPSLNKPDANYAHLTNARVALRLTPSPELTIDASVLRNQTTAVDFGATEPGLLVFTPPSGSMKFVSPLHDTLDVAALTINYDFGPATLVAASSATKHENDADKDLSQGIAALFGVDGSVDQLYQTYSQSVSQEIRLVSNGHKTLDWTVGAYYKDEKRHIYEGYHFLIPAFGNLNDQSLQRSDQTGKSWALFGELDWQLTDRLGAQIGLRYFSEKKDYINRQLLSSVIVGSHAGDFVTGSDSASATSPKIELSYKLTPNSLAFAKVSKGFRGGGANIVPLNRYPEASGSYGPDSLIAYEVGLKTTFASNWYINAYLFDNKWKDLQLSFRTKDQIFGYTTNAGSATGKGGEIELGGHIGTGLTVGLTYSYTDSTIDTDVIDPSGGIAAKAGNEIPESPKSKFGFSASYTTQLNASLNGNLNLRFRQASGYFSEPGNLAIGYNDGSQDLFASIGVSGHWGVLSLYGDNLQNRDDTTLRYKPLGVLPYVYANYVRPRNVGIEYKGTF